MVGELRCDVELLAGATGSLVEFCVGNFYIIL
jgi:hypothetical protein